MLYRLIIMCVLLKQFDQVTASVKHSVAGEIALLQNAAVKMLVLLNNTVAEFTGL